MRVLDVSKVRGSLAEIVEAVRQRGDVVVIIRYRRPIAALVPVDRLTDLERKALGAVTRGMGKESPGTTGATRRRAPAKAAPIR